MSVKRFGTPIASVKRFGIQILDHFTFVFQIAESRPRSGIWAHGSGILSGTMYLSISFIKSTPPQNRQLDIMISNSKQVVDDLVVELTF